jgi:hypothetical protein
MPESRRNPRVSPSEDVKERCAACLERLLTYIEIGNEWVELKARSASGPAQSKSAQLQCARRRKTDARRHLLLHQGPFCGSCPNHIRPA